MQLVRGGLRVVCRVAEVSSCFSLLRSAVSISAAREWPAVSGVCCYVAGGSTC